ncbi:hypothetical protein D3C76_1561650 [compost metagenome]
MTGVQERLEGLVRQLRRLPLVVAGFLQGTEQHPPAQRTDAMLQAGLFAQHLLANRKKMLHRHAAQVWCVVGEPLAEYGFGAGDHRCGVPQGVVQVESDQLDGHDSSPLMRLALGWALS